MDERTARKCLGAHRDKLTRQQLLTLRGQIRAGNIDAAMKGLNKILANKQEKVVPCHVNKTLT